MSRVGKKIISLPEGTKVDLSGDQVEIQGPKGHLSSVVPKGIRFELTSRGVLAIRSSDSKEQKSLHSLAPTLLANAEEGDNKGV